MRNYFERYFERNLMSARLKNEKYQMSIVKLESFHQENEQNKIITPKVFIDKPKLLLYNVQH